MYYDPNKSLVRDLCVQLNHEAYQVETLIVYFAMILRAPRLSETAVRTVECMLIRRVRKRKVERC
jgi:hypothetical protein